jgi:hypothetical protein
MTCSLVPGLKNSQIDRGCCRRTVLVSQLPTPPATNETRLAKDECGKPAICVLPISSLVSTHGHDNATIT